MKEYIIVKKHKAEGHEHEEQEHKAEHKVEECERRTYGLPNEKAANDIMGNKGYIDYVRKHGNHFTPKLADYVSKMMVNANGKVHTWTTEQVVGAMQKMGFSIPSKVTDGDVAYTANMAYADFYPELLKDDEACLRYAYMVANDPDGYEGMPFSRWTADAIGKSVKLNWEKFV